MAFSPAEQPDNSISCGGSKEGGGGRRVAAPFWRHLRFIRTVTSESSPPHNFGPCYARGLEPKMKPCFDNIYSGSFLIGPLKCQNVGQGLDIKVSILQWYLTLRHGCPSSHHEAWYWLIWYCPLGTSNNKVMIGTSQQISTSGVAFPKMILHFFCNKRKIFWYLFKSR